MYKVFLVEDEDSIRTRIREHFPWEENGFLLSGEAPDGELAIPLIKELQPDILITDIMMPFMNGIELSKAVRSMMPWIKIIIVSGYDDFKYAKEAISIGASEYILKPVKPSELAEVLKKTADKLDEEKRKIQAIEEYEKSAIESLSILKERFLLETVLFSKTPSDIVEKSLKFDIDLRARYYSIVVLTIQPEKPGTGLSHVEILKLNALINRMESGSSNILTCPYTIDETIMIITGDSSDAVEQTAQGLSEEIHRQCDELVSANVEIGIGKTCTRLSDLNNSYRGAKRALDFRFLFKGRSIISEEDTEHLGTEQSGILTLNQEGLTEFLKFSREDEAEEFLSTYISPFDAKTETGVFYLRFFFLFNLLSCGHFIEELSGNVSEVLPELNRIDEEIAAIDNLETLKYKTADILRRVIHFRTNRDFSRYGKRIEDATYYIDKNFANPSLSLQDVASVANLSQCRFSTIFKQETGNKFTEHLTRVRMNKAIELLKTSSQQISEIANEVGYNDSHYFSYLFKKVTGFTPTQLRDGIG